jgi:DNA-directed RNA polymerase subunit RPC12/RpoP
MCGVLLCNIGEGSGELTLFFDDAASKETRRLFEIYVQVHLQRRALLESIKRRDILACPTCGTTFTELQVRYRRERGHKLIRCSVCDSEILLLDRKKEISPTSLSSISAIDQAADSRREFEKATSIDITTLHGSLINWQVIDHSLKPLPTDVSPNKNEGDTDTQQGTTHPKSQ